MTEQNFPEPLFEYTLFLRLNLHDELHENFYVNLLVFLLLHLFFHEVLLILFSYSLLVVMYLANSSNLFSSVSLAKIFFSKSSQSLNCTIPDGYKHTSPLPKCFLR